MNPSKPESFNHRTETLTSPERAGTATESVKYHFVDQKPDNYDPAKTVTLLLVHGFPDLWFGWRHQIIAWVKAGYRVIAPDMLGYGGSEKPAETEAYTFRKLSGDLAALLDVAGVQKAVVLGHDWGSLIVGRFALWHPDRLLALVQLSIPFFKPSPEDKTPSKTGGLQQVVKLYPNMGYQLYFADPASTKEIEANISRLFNLFFSDQNNQDNARPQFTHEGQLRKVVNGDESLIGSFDFNGKKLIPAEELEYVISQFSNSMHGPLQYYRTTDLRHQEEQEYKLYERKINSELPYLFVYGKRDLTSIEKSDPSKPEPTPQEKLQAFRASVGIPNALAVPMDSGHWLMLEAKDKVTEGILNWLSGLKL